METFAERLNDGVIRPLREKLDKPSMAVMAIIRAKTVLRVDE
jgi:hypothetical protein